MKTIVAIIGGFLTISLVTFASRHVNPPSKSDVVGVWVGYEESYPYFYKLRLDNDNRGSLVILYTRGNAGTYLLRWQLDNAKVMIQPTPMNSDSEKIGCSVTRLDNRRIDIVTKGTSNQWTRTAILFNEKELAANIAKSTEHESRK